MVSSLMITLLILGFQSKLNKLEKNTTKLKILAAVIVTPLLMHGFHSSGLINSSVFTHSAIRSECVCSLKLQPSSRFTLGVN